MNRRKRVLAGAIIAILAVVGAVWYWLGRSTTDMQQPSSQSGVAAQQKQQSQLQQQYTTLPANHRFREAPVDEVLQLFEKGSGLVFLGFPECPWCQQLAPIVNEAAEAENSEVVYLNIRQARADNDATYQKLVEKLAPHLRKDDQGKPRIFVPDVTAVRDGTVAGHFLQETTADGEKATPESYWTDERRQRAVERLRAMIRQTKAFAGIEAAVRQGAVLLDVRTDAEFKSGHAPLATHLALQDIQRGVLPNVDKNTTVYVYCRSGNRSAQAKRLLEKAGFTKVQDLGGLQDVQRLGASLVQE